MTDIVERLRKTADHEWIGHKTWTMAALREAADEIERLRADLAQRDRELASILLQLEQAWIRHDRHR
jgi:hypothetical protein